MSQAEVDTTQLLKGVLDLAVLAVLADAVWAAYRRTMSLSDSLSAGKDPEPMPPRSES